MDDLPPPDSLLVMFLTPQELALKVMDIELPAPVMVHLLDEMSNTEERLAHGGSERLQLGSLVGAFATARYTSVDRTSHLLRSLRTFVCESDVDFFDSLADRTAV